MEKGKNLPKKGEDANIILEEIKLYKRRWFMLFLYVMYAAASAMQWVEYCIITNIVTKYYGVSARAVDWTSLITMVTYPPLLLPGTYIIDKMGLRAAALFGVMGTALGTWIKVFSVRPDLFWVTFLGQTVVFVAQIFILSLPPKLAAVWFGEHEVSRACGIGVFGQQLGCALGFIIPPMLVKNHDNLDDIGHELSTMFYGVAGFTTPIAILVFIYFEAEPKLPPSNAQITERLRFDKAYTMKDMYESYRTLLTNKPFLYLCLCYGLNVGVFAALCTVLNQFVLSYFPNSAEDAGMIGLLMIILGMIGSVLFGYILDRTRKYKEITLIVYVLTFLGVVAFMVSLEMYDKSLVYITGSVMGFFMNSYYPVGFEMAAELTFPEPESTSSGILISSAQIFGMILILVSGWMLDNIGTFWALMVMSSMLLLGSVLTIFIPNNLKRQEAFALKAQFQPVEN